MDNQKAAFQELLKVWEQETMLISSVTEMENHYALKAIVKMGKPAIPLILTELQKKPSHIFIALAKITGINPVKPGHAGKLDKITDDWLKWGKKMRYLD